MSKARLVTACLVGTSIEFYDFFLYGTAAALIFPRVFFPSLDPVAGTLAALSTYAVAFVARPLGSALFGHWGDRTGRKSTLVVSLLLTGLATAAIGVLPGYGAIGTAAPVLLVALRFAQGIGLGGEWAGAALLATESAPAGRRGRYAGFPQLGPAIGFILANGLFLVLDRAMDEAAFVRWGWRVPFLASLLLVAVGLYVRTRLGETPVFRAAAAVRAPLLELLRQQWREVLLAAGAVLPGYALFYTTTVYVLSYGTGTLHIPRTTMLVLMLAAVTVKAAVTLASASLSDRWGRRRVLLAATALAAAWSLVMFPLIDTASLPMVGLALAVSLAVMGLMYGPVGAFFPELFATRYRYSGAALAYNLGGVLGGALSPMLAVTHPGAIGWYLSAAALVGVLCLGALGRTVHGGYTRLDLRDHPHPAAARRQRLAVLSMADDVGEARGE